jgi:hypothetical protein
MARGGARPGAGRPRKKSVNKNDAQKGTSVDVVKAEDRCQSQSSADASRKVEALAGFGLVDTEIAHVLGITVSELKSRYGAEVLKGPAQAVANVARSLYGRATDPDKPDVNACIFWLRAMGGWNDKADKGQLGKKEAKSDAAKKAATGRFSQQKQPFSVVEINKK